ncbi:N-acetylgalactosaminyltransferase 6-like isoform X1 [Diorhabda sublineata]|uniref:N-acetylgalactosaminyltransferase 6-like isoform X1 n=1 Tax=Diorhabda sublineata TaxID=1163346 RepID=UPI0024E1214A|nr:N-acetylgalactosaminyltransferase 6-like isoform X1 [Diorhabda sublineata]
MRRNLKTLLKYILLSSVTVVFTVLIYRIFKTRTYRIDSRVYFGINNGIEPVAPEAIVLVDNEKIDWHDYERIKRDASRTGRGEQGKAAYLDNSETAQYDALYKVNGFNALLSDKIALDRAVPDIRHVGCKSKKYLKNLPTVSVIVPFHNEHWTTLLRTAVSVINRSPPHLLKEIILVDDFSSKPFTKKPLDDYLAANLTKVRTIHLPERSGLIRARLAGAREATADVLIFLDSHTEANVNWLPPLLGIFLEHKYHIHILILLASSSPNIKKYSSEPIAQDYKTCVCPFIDVIAYETFEYRAQDEGARGAFDWEFFYKRLPLLPEDLKRPTEPFKSPVMAGGLFAISRKFFWELGGYDEGLDIWGGEQYELSFKIWQCGGQMYDAPCSRVGHIYRKFAPFPNPGKGDFVGRNYRRVAEVWMDEYAEYLYKRRPHYKNIDPGDLTAQRAIRKNLQCKSFKWFMETIAFDLPLRYPPIEPDDFGYGEIRNVGVPELCVDSSKKQKNDVVGVAACVKGTARAGSQSFTLTWHKDLRITKRTDCLDVSDPNDKAEITLYSCHGMKGNQYWKYDVEKQWFIHGGNPRCLDIDPGKLKLYVTTCDENSITQKWRFENVNLTMIADWDNIGVKQ